MSRVFNEITAAYPALTAKLSTIPPEEASDRQLMAELASHIVDLFESSKLAEIKLGFDLTEGFVADGTAEQREAAILGFLETIQNVASHRQFGPDVFRKFLGARSSLAWSEINVVWRGKTSLAEVVTAEMGATLRPRWWQFWKRHNRPNPRNLLDQVQDPELRKIIEQITRE